MIYILDACALVAIFKSEKSADKVQFLLNEAKTGQNTIYMHIINLIEVYYLFYRDLGKDKANEILKEIRKYPITIVDTIDDTIFAETSRLKATYSLPLGDAVGVATAIKFNGSFVSGDHSDLEKIESAESISMFWFR